MQEGDGHWGLLLVKYSMVMMEIVIWGGVFLFSGAGAA